VEKYNKIAENSYYELWFYFPTTNNSKWVYFRLAVKSEYYNVTIDSVVAELKFDTSCNRFYSITVKQAIGIFKRLLSTKLKQLCHGKVLLRKISELGIVEADKQAKKLRKLWKETNGNE